MALNVFSRRKQPQPYSPQAETVRQHFYQHEGQTDGNSGFHETFDRFPAGSERLRLSTEFARYAARERGDAEQVVAFAIAGIDPEAIPDIRADLHAARARERQAERPAS